MNYQTTEGLLFIVYYSFFSKVLTKAL